MYNKHLVPSSANLHTVVAMTTKFKRSKTKSSKTVLTRRSPRVTKNSKEKFSFLRKRFAGPSCFNKGSRATRLIGLAIQSTTSSLLLMVSSAWLNGKRPTAIKSHNLSKSTRLLSQSFAYSCRGSRTTCTRVTTCSGRRRISWSSIARSSLRASS